MKFGLNRFGHSSKKKQTGSLSSLQEETAQQKIVYGFQPLAGVAHAVSSVLFLSCYKGSRKYLLLKKLDLSVQLYVGKVCGRMVVRLQWTSFLIASIMLQIQGQNNDLCAGVTCNNKGTCLPNTGYSRGYWCQCDEGWAGQDCFHPEPTVNCGDDRITVVIDKGLIRELGIDDDVRYVYFGRSTASPQCRASDENNFYRLTIRAPFSTCGTQTIQRAVGDDYTFSNTVVWNREVNNPNNLIDRELVLLDFKCIYEDSYTTVGPPLLPDSNVIHVITERGQFEVRMRLFDDKSYSPDHEYRDSPSVAIGTYVYVQVELEHVKDESLVVTLDRCFASQSYDPADPISTKHILIADRCVNSNDTTIHIRSNGESHQSRFRFQMFKWRWSADDVYLHCEVDICNKTRETCTEEDNNCRGQESFRRKRETLTHEGVYDPSFVPHVSQTISQGPIHVQSEEENQLSNAQYEEDSEVDTTVVVLGVVLGMVLLLFGMAGGVYARRRQQDTKLNAKKEAEEATRKRFTSLHFTTESF